MSERKFFSEKKKLTLLKFKKDINYKNIFKSKTNKTAELAL